MRKFPKFSAMLAAAVILPSLFSAIPASAAIYSAPTLKSPTSNQTLTNYPRNTSFSWNAVSGAKSYKLEVACDVCVSKTTKWQGAKTYTVSGTSYSVKMLGDNEHRWRVRAVDYSNNLGPWSGYSYFKYRTGKQNTTTPTTIGTPTLVSPADEATVAQHYVNLDWTNVTGATSYEYEVTKYNGSSWESIRRGNISSSNASVTLPYGDYGQYSLHVRAIKNGSYGSWSEYHQFYYSNGSSTTGAPAIYSPYENQAFSGHDVSINWSNVSGATSYEVNVNYYQDDSWVNQGTYTAYTNPYSLTFYNNNNYRLRVRAVLSGSTYGNWSDWREFVVAADNYSKPTITFPSSNGQTFHAETIIIQWPRNASSYDYELEKYNASSGNWEDKESGAVTYSIGHVLAVAKYGEGQYRFRTSIHVFSSGNYSDWSDWRDFYLYNATITAAPTISQPTENQVISGSNVNFTWNNISGVSQYVVMVKPNEFTAQVTGGYAYYTANQNSYTFAATGNAHKYMAKVCLMFGPNQYGACSPTRYFELNSSSSYTSGAPTIYNPYEDQTLSDHNVSISWSSVSGATSYEVNVNYYQDGSWVNQGTYTAYTNPYSLTFYNDNNYRLRVRAIFSGYTYGNWSDWREFVVGTGGSYTTGAPTIYSPYEDQTLSNHNVNIDWSDVSGAASYEVNVNYYQDGSWVNQGTYTAYQNPYSLTLYNDDNYRLRIRAVFSGYTYGNWSDWREFVVGTGGGDGSYNYEAPTLYTPNAGVTYGTQVYTYWSANEDAESYKINVQYKSGSSWYEERTQTVSGATSVILSFSNDNDYRLRVQSVFPGGSVSSWSEWREFGVDGNSNDYSDSSAPTVYDPYNGETFTSDSVYMSWSTISGAVSYEVEIDYESGSYWYDEGTYSTSYQNYTKVFYSDNDYRMRVRAKYSGGTYTSWSNWYEFTVDETGGYDYSPPTISEPENNETFTAETVYIGWTSVYTAVSYEVEIDYKSGSNWYDEGTYATSNLYYIKTFSGDNNYRVRARAKFFDNSYTNWSAWREFVVNAD